MPRRRQRRRLLPERSLSARRRDSCRAGHPRRRPRFSRQRRRPLRRWRPLAASRAGSRGSHGRGARRCGHRAPAPRPAPGCLRGAQRPAAGRARASPADWRPAAAPRPAATALRGACSRRQARRRRSIPVAPPGRTRRTAPRSAHRRRTAHGNAPRGSSPRRRRRRRLHRLRRCYPAPRPAGAATTGAVAAAAASRWASFRRPDSFWPGRGHSARPPPPLDLQSAECAHRLTANPRALRRQQDSADLRHYCRSSIITLDKRNALGATTSYVNISLM
mmetsp:Transcript_19980/g.60503  ORF Transcript_19980/g.60503 Transcript_19980/m.60503 type:complete len:276 (+) Transcript_19980:435-1262(+)